MSVASALHSRSGGADEAAVPQPLPSHLLNAQRHQSLPAGLVLEDDVGVKVEHPVGGVEEEGGDADEAPGIQRHRADDLLLGGRQPEVAPVHLGRGHGDVLHRDSRKISQTWSRRSMCRINTIVHHWGLIWITQNTMICLFRSEG